MEGSRPSLPTKLSRGALAFRAVHASIAAEQLLAISYVWWCALSGRRDRLLGVAAATLMCEGVLVAANRGDCPLGGVQERLGDPVPLFELVLAPHAAKRAVPMLGSVTAVGLLLLMARGRHRVGKQGSRRPGSAAWSQLISKLVHAGQARRGRSGYFDY